MSNNRRKAKQNSRFFGIKARQGLKTTEAWFGPTRRCWWRKASCGWNHPQNSGMDGCSFPDSKLQWVFEKCFPPSDGKETLICWSFIREQADCFYRSILNIPNCDLVISFVWSHAKYAVSALGIQRPFPRCCKRPRKIESILKPFFSGPWAGVSVWQWLELTDRCADSNPCIM